MGRTRTTAAAAAGVTPETVGLHRAADDVFRAMETQAELDRDGAVEGALRQAAVEKLNVPAIQTYLYNRMPEQWKDQRSVAVTGQVTLAALVESIEDEGLKDAEGVKVSDVAQPALSEPSTTVADEPKGEHDGETKQRTQEQGEGQAEGPHQEDKEQGQA